MALSNHISTDKCYEDSVLLNLDFISSEVSEYKRKALVKSNEVYGELSFDLLKSWPCKDGWELGGMLKCHVSNLCFILCLERLWSGPMNTTC